MRRILLLLLILLLTVYGAAAAESGDPADAVRALTATPCDRLFLSGEYLGVRAGIGIDLNDFGLSITMPDDRPDAPESFAGLLAGDTF